MPNWCNNELKIYGDDKQLKKFIKKAKGTKKDKSDLVMNNLLPLPKEKDGDWDDWQVKNWGTKWDIEATLAFEDEGIAEYYFNSAWSPPIQFFENISKKYPDLVFVLKYDEAGAGFTGVAKVQNGEVNDKFIEY